MRAKSMCAERIGWLAVNLLLAAIILFPVYWMLVASLLPTSITLSSAPPLFPTAGFSFDGYIHAITARPLMTWLVNSMLVTTAVCLVSLAISIPAGYSLSRFRRRSTSAVGYSLLLARMLPGTLLSLPLFAAFATFGLIDSMVALSAACVTITVPFTAWLMKGFFDSVPREIEDAARIDGCTRFRALLAVVMPLTGPGIAATSVYAAILAWSDLLFSRTLMTRPENWTLPVGVSSFIGAHDIDWGGMLAAGAIATVPMAILFAALEPLLTGGMTAGSTKG